MPDDPKKDPDKSLCMTCMRCILVCPIGARGQNKVILAAAGQKMKKVCSGYKENELYLLI